VVRKKADETLAKVKGGADFAEVAKQVSEDSSASAGGDLGTFGRGVMVPPFETAAFALEPGQISEIVESPFGFHIIKLEEKFPERTDTLETVRPTIVNAIQQQQARGIALKKVEDAHERLLDGAPIGQIATDNNIALQEPPPFGRDEAVGSLGIRPEIAKEAFATTTGEVGEIVSEPSGYTVLAVEERLPSKIPALDAVFQKVEDDYRRQLAAEAAKTKAAALLTTLKATPDLDALAKSENLTVEESAQIGRFGPYLPNLGNAQDLKDAAFKLTPEAPVAPAVYVVKDDAVIAVLVSKVPADEAKFDAEKGGLRDRLQQQAEAAALRQFIDQLKASATIRYGQGFSGSPLGQS
jgi:peptidyl-prolyl cis-trans isomerase D